MPDPALQESRHDVGWSRESDLASFFFDATGACRTSFLVTGFLALGALVDFFLARPERPPEDLDRRAA